MRIKPSAALIVIAFAVGTVLSACAVEPSPSATAPAQVSGVYLDNRDLSVRPQDNFFEYVNGAWLASHAIPEDKSSDGSFGRLREAADADVKSIIEQAAAADSAQMDSAQGRISALYNSFMDEARVNALGVSPLQADLQRIDGITTQRQLLDFFAYAEGVGTASPLGVAVEADFAEPERHRFYIFQSGLGLPNSDYYIDDSDKGREITAAYQHYMAQLYRQLGYSEAQAESAAGATWELEVAIASVHRPPESNRDYARWHNLYGPGQAALPAGVDWQHWLAAYNLPKDTVLSVAQPEYLQGFAALMQETSLAQWRDYLKLRLASSTAPYLDQPMQELNFEFYARQLQGTPQIRPRWQRGVNLVNGTIGEDVGRIYVQEHFPATSKERMDELVVNLIAAYRESIESLTWMGDETKANALAKLSKFTANIGYPRRWKDYSAMQLGPELIENVKASNRWMMADALAKLDKPVDKTEWAMNPQMVNAYYSPLQNSINFPAAILQPPFFDPLADDAVNYGAIGAVIGHEIGHGFDDRGAQFDGDGRLFNWWTDADREAFKARTALLIEQYDAFELLPDLYVNGTYTQGENIGDLAGASIAYKAYLSSRGGKTPPVMDGYSGEQRFFIGFAQAFLGHSREQRARQMIKSDSHSPEIFRVNGTLSNIDGFYQAFAIKPGDALYRAPAQRVSIW